MNSRTRFEAHIDRYILSVFNGLLATRMANYPFGTLGKQVQRRIDNNLDAKIVITSYSSTPGLGKTTLAIKMAREWDRHGWAAEDKSFMTYERFHNAYMEEPPGSVLLFDEVENEADARRSMSDKNVGLSKLLATQRVRNIISIYTLPAVSMLDKRVMELADFWINVGINYQKGIAYPHQLWVNDYSWTQGSVSVTPQRLGDNEILTWEDVEPGDPDKAYLDSLKGEQNHLESKHIPESEVEAKIEKAEEQARRELRDTIITGLDTHEELNISHQKIADCEGIDVSRQRVQQIANGG